MNTWKFLTPYFLMRAFSTEWDKNLDLCSKKCKLKLSICWKNNRQFKADTLAPCFLIKWMICLKRVNGLSNHENSDQLQIWFKSKLCPAVFHCREALFTKLPTIAQKNNYLHLSIISLRIISRLYYSKNVMAHHWLLVGGFLPGGKRSWAGACV